MTNKSERYKLEIPELVRQAISLAEELGIPQLIIPASKQHPANSAFFKDWRPKMKYLSGILILFVLVLSGCASIIPQYRIQN